MSFLEQSMRADAAWNTRKTLDGASPDLIAGTLDALILFYGADALRMTIAAVESEAHALEDLPGHELPWWAEPARATLREWDLSTPKEES